MGKWNLYRFRNQEFSKENIAVHSFLTLHTTQTTTEAISLILKKKNQIPQKICRHINSNYCVCLRNDISEVSYTIVIRNMPEFLVLFKMQ